MNEIYIPREDSYLLTRILKKQIPKLIAENKNLKSLEVGCGSGIQLLTLKSLGIKNIFGVDINKKAVEHCKKLGLKCTHSNLFQNVKGKFDLIIFNPPYLPLDSREPKDSRVATTGGEKGSELTNRFLKQAKKHLAKNGIIFLVSSSLTKGINFQGFRKKILDSKKLFFEELRVWEIY
ncbi:DUF2431 domain-containing protein [Candidatus Pacearchaeota archaeon]|nr:DUF2431 domain-containing protein [Candidatus Pacearchaeota archaeon]